jgi:cyclopropane fatty-acyl-phospholipid synthase-like methyltransferase
MAKHICPFWVAYFLLNPLRRLLENPYTIFAPYVRQGMVVLEPGCGMGYFTLPLARMLGPAGRIVAVDIQKKMLSSLAGRAARAGLLDRIEVRLASTQGLGVEDISGQVDVALAFHMVHELTNEHAFFTEVRNALKRGGKLLVVEPKFHVSQKEFSRTISIAQELGFADETVSPKVRGRAAFLIKQGS